MIRVIGLCGVYFVAYVIFGVATKYFLGQGMPGMEWLFNSTVASMVLVTGTVTILWWPGRLKSTQPRVWGFIPREYLWLIPSGVCTGFVVPTTTLLYSFGFSVLVAMIIMRGSLIAVSRGVDEVLIRQGHSNKRVFWQENAAVVTAMMAVLLIILWGTKGKEGSFDFLHSTPFMVTLGCYIIPYSIRLYILNRFKTKMDSRALLGIEQLGAFGFMSIVMIAVVVAFRMGYLQFPQVADFNYGVFHPTPKALFWSLSFGVAAFASVFLYIYKGGSATFNTTINRLTSLMAGTTATLVFHYGFGGRAVRPHEWGALVLVVIATGFLTWAGMRRTAEKNAATPA